jgi:hypothetical protein
MSLEDIILSEINQLCKDKYMRALESSNLYAPKGEWWGSGLGEEEVGIVSNGDRPPVWEDKSVLKIDGSEATQHRMSLIFKMVHFKMAKMVNSVT